MKFITPYKKVTDARGIFIGIINSGTWEEINMIETEAGNVRGGHYHKEILELFYILEGRIEISISKANGGERQICSIGEGQIILVEPFEVHTFRCLTKCKWINALSRKIDELSPDFYR